MWNEKFSLVLRFQTIRMTKINKIKSILNEKGITSKWLAAQLDVDPTTVSKWCTNSSQPDILTLLKIANLLDLEVTDLYDEEIISQYSSKSMFEFKPN